MEILVCIKRVPMVGGKVTLTADSQAVDSKFLAFTMSPHEECAVEEAVRLIANHAGRSTVLTVGPAAAEEQLRYAMSMGIDDAVLIDCGEKELGPVSVAAEIGRYVSATADEGRHFDLLLFGNEAADTGDFQVGVRVAESLDLPCLSGLKQLDISGTGARGMREASGAQEIMQAPLPLVCTVKEGINLPRYPSMPGRLRAKSKSVEKLSAASLTEDVTKVGLRVPQEARSAAEVLGRGAEAAPRVAKLLVDLGLVPV
jgi:electron transfer flavoprotein beta subunit